MTPQPRGAPAAGETRATLPCSPLTRAASRSKVMGDCGYIPSERLEMGRQDYDPYAEVTKMHPSLRAALEKKD